MKVAAVLATVLAVASAHPEVKGGWPKCRGDMEYDAVAKLCKCDKGEQFDPEIQKCRLKEVESIKVSSCPKGQALYCYRNEKEFVKYGMWTDDAPVSFFPPLDSPSPAWQGARGI